MYKCCRHRRLYSVRKIIVPIWSLSKGKIRETLYQILTYTRYIYIRMNTEANCQLYVFLSLSLSKKRNLMISHLPWAVLNIRLFLSDLDIVCKPMILCRFFHVHVCTFGYICITNDQTVVTTWPSLFRFCLEKKIRLDPRKKKHITMSFPFYSFLLSFLLSRWASICQTYLIKWMT